MRLNFTIVTAGVWQCMERPEIQVRNCKARMSKVDPRAVEAYPGWAVFVNGIELLTAGREKAKRHAVENAQAYVDREAEVAEAARKARQRQDRKLIGPARAHLDAPCTDACYEAEASLDPRHAPPLDVMAALAALTEAVRAELSASPVPADPATDDEVSELVDRIVRRSQYQALKAVLEALDGWIAGNLENVEGGIGELEAVHRFHAQDVRRMVNDAARELRVPEPYRADDV
jgi:hypothetical protein